MKKFMLFSLALLLSSMLGSAVATTHQVTNQVETSPPASLNAFISVERRCPPFCV